MLCEVLSLGEGGIGDNFVAGQYATVEIVDAARLPRDQRMGRRSTRERTTAERAESRATFQDTNGISVSAFSERKDAAKGVRAVHDHPQFVENNMLVEGNPSVVPDVYGTTRFRQSTLRTAR